MEITEANGTYQDTGLSITLPMAGTYLIWVDVRGTADPATNPPGWITAMLYNATDNVYITESERLVAVSS
jgi:hypothetical protein